jgi:predicted negative regulator of RcsB-dependent stress response
MNKSNTYTAIATFIFTLFVIFVYQFYQVKAEVQAQGVVLQQVVTFLSAPKPSQDVPVNAGLIK